MKVRCIDARGASLTEGAVYEAEEKSSDRKRWRITDDFGSPYDAFRTRFEPVTDEPEEEPCLCNSDRGPRSCPEHGVRCHNPDCDKLCDRIDSMSSLDANGKVSHWCSEACWRESHFTEQPKADPYERHREEFDEGECADYYAKSQRNEDKFSGATARLLRGLEGEKVREQVRAFPHPARNPR